MSCILLLVSPSDVCINQLAYLLCSFFLFSSSSHLKIFFFALVVFLPCAQEYHHWESFISDRNEASPASFQGFETTDSWVRMKVELAFIVGTIKSVAISVFIASFSCLLFTHNTYLTLLCTFCIVCIVFCLLGLFVVWGWEFGALEALSLPTVVGLSVDYQLHLAHSYNHARVPFILPPGLSERQIRTHMAGTEIGKSPCFSFHFLI